MDDHELGRNDVVAGIRRDGNVLRDVAKCELKIRESIKRAKDLSNAAYHLRRSKLAGLIKEIGHHGGWVVAQRVWTIVPTGSQ